jgi:acid stress-induced BolA-like protein IbaG/YrbA
MGCYHHFKIAAVSNQLETNMSERQDTLKKARERMIEDRDAHAKVLAAPFDRDKAERARIKFVEMQGVIDAIDRAIAGGE